jgi:YidC/Oxa1 family membrane protein insertase
MLLITANIFQPLIDVFESVLKGIHGVIGGSWGWSIVLLTVLIRALLIPLTLKQFHSMQKLQRLQPQMKELQNRYKDDKQRQQQELMKFYKENQVNPLGSCLPLVAQLPVFISLFYMLRSTLRIDICPQTQRAAQHIGPMTAINHAHTVPCGPNNGAGFLFIPDLTNKASGAVLVVLIVLYVGTQLGSSLLMSSPTMDKTQRQIMLVMPLFFVIFIINFPAGVIVYWITTNTWTIGQQYIVRRRLGPIAPPVVAATGGSSGAASAKPERARPAKEQPVQAKKNGSEADGAAAAAAAAGTGAAAAATGGGLGGLLRGRTKDKEAAAVVADSGPRGAPPPPPRKKKKRSGRRR